MKSQKIEPIDLEVRESAAGYELVWNDRRLNTSIGDHPVVHDAPALLQHMISEFTCYSTVEVYDNQIIEPQTIDAYRLFGLQKEFIETGTDNLSENFVYEVYKDPVLHRIAGPEHQDQLARYVPLMEWLADHDVALVDRDFVTLNASDAPGGASMHKNKRNAARQESSGPDTADFYRLAEWLKRQFTDLSPEERACVVYLHNGLEGALIHTIALLRGAITLSDFAVGVGAAHMVIESFPDVSAEEHQEFTNQLRSYAVAAIEYVRAYREGTLAGRLTNLLAQGSEGAEIEFKSTLRWDLKLGTNSREVTNSVVKTVAAFLNTRGGTLLIGVADDKSIVGLELDAFASEDEYLRHLYEVLRNALGTHVTPFVVADVVRTARGGVCVVECQRSPEPVLCQLKNKPDAFFVRAGPSTVNLVGEDRETFKRVHWGNG